jgi:hypothetical protein
MAEDVDGICGGLRVVDITRGIAGPITTMLLADHGADVVRIEPPGGDNLVDLPGSAVWNRGKRRPQPPRLGVGEKRKNTHSINGSHTDMHQFTSRNRRKHFLLQQYPQQ